MEEDVIVEEFDDSDVDPVPLTAGAPVPLTAEAPRPLTGSAVDASAGMAGVREEIRPGGMLCWKRG